MVDKPKTPEDFDNMSDEDFLKLDESDYSGDVPEGQGSLTQETPDEPTPEPEVVEEEAKADEPVVDDESSDGDPELDQSDADFVAAGEPKAEEAESETPEGATDPHAGEGETPDPEEGKEATPEPKADAKEEGKDPAVKETPAKAGYYKLPEGMDTAAMDAAVGFHKQITAPFKADGKDFTIRSAEDAIRLMQQGVNYSRRMQEIKPMKALNRTLVDHNLNTPEKLNFLIDLSKGDKAAITQLLKSHKIDPMDLDIEKDSGYQARNYQGSPQDNEFRDALDNAITTPEGQALVTHIQKDWDATSKARLREDPSVLGNLQQMKASGVYDKVVAELEYQKSIGYLTGVPFLQAFDQVGEAMKNAGVFNEAQKPAPSANPLAPLQSGQNQDQPVASGARKSTTTKKVETNPHLSSTPPTKQSGNPAADPDFDKMSDEDFLKMAPPS